MYKNLTRNDIISFLKSKKEYLRNSFGVLNAGLIGSYARDEQTENSDIDLIVEFDEPSFDKLAGLYIYLEKNFEKKIDIIIKSIYLRKRFLDLVQKEVVYV